MCNINTLTFPSFPANTTPLITVQTRKSVPLDSTLPSNSSNNVCIKKFVRVPCISRNLFLQIISPIFFKSLSKLLLLAKLQQIDVKLLFRDSSLLIQFFVKLLKSKLIFQIDHLKVEPSFRNDFCLIRFHSNFPVSSSFRYKP